MGHGRQVIAAVLGSGVLGTGVFFAAPPHAAPAPTARAASARVPLSQHPGKLLAGNCFQCHGTNGKGGPFEGIAGENANELYQELKDLQRENDPESAIMRVHALAYTDAQLRLIADFFAQVPGGGGN